jgi:hypothetical protein
MTKNWPTAWLLSMSLLLTLLPLPTLAQGLFEAATTTAEEPADGATDGGSMSTGGGLNAEWNGHLRADIFAGKVPGADEGEIKQGYGEFALSLRARKGSWGDAFGEFRLWQGNDLGQNETRFTLREAYVNAYLGPIDLRIGQQVIVWGRADGNNPTNNLTPVDMRVRSPNEDDKRLGNLAVRLSAFFQPIRLEAIWVPFYAPSHLPNFKLGEILAFDDAEHPSNNLENGTIAGRINLEGTVLDGSLSYLYGYAPLPGLTFKDIELAGATPTISVAFKPYRQHVVGMDFSTTVSDWFGLRGEAAYKHPVEDGDADYEPLPEIHYVVGIDRQIGDFMGVVQYIGRYTFDWTALPDYGIDLASGSPDMAAMAQVEGGPMAVIATQLTEKNRMVRGQLNEWSHMAMTRLAWAFLYETLDVEVMGMFDFMTEEYFARAMVAYDIADALTLTLGGEMWGGPNGTLSGTIDELMSAGFLELKASF